MNRQRHQQSPLQWRLDGDGAIAISDPKWTEKLHLHVRSVRYGSARLLENGSWRTIVGGRGVGIAAGGNPRQDL
jgi:hypothetical protein